jgi:hypothetical protein
VEATVAEKKEPKKERATFKTVRSYPYGSAELGGSEVLRDSISTGVHFKDAEGGEKKAREYASEMQRETRGMKKGGTASSRADGCAMRGKTRGRMV